MNDLQRTEFEILQEVIEICEKLDIRCFLLCGSALGAAKYQGFIPWDDDVDLGMYREDYVRFLREAPQYLPAHLFLQTHRTDPAYPQIFAKVRNSNTTYIEKSVSGVNMHHGIGVDIFPLDGYPAEKIQQDRLERKKKIYTRLLSCVYSGGNWKVRALRVCLRMLGVHRRTGQILDRYEQMIASYPVEASGIVCNHGNWQGKLEYFTTKQFGDGAWSRFEGIRVRIPEDYDAYLTQKYGAWREDLPPEQQVGHHYYAVCDPTVSYRCYIQQQPDGSIKLK